MSLELALQENTQALREFTALMSQMQAAPATTAAPAAQAEPPAKKPEAEKPAPTPTATETATPPPEAPAPAEAAAESPSDGGAPSLSELTVATTEAARRNRAGLLPLIESYGVKRAGSIPEDKWAEYIAKAKAL